MNSLAMLVLRPESRNTTGASNISIYYALSSWFHVSNPGAAPLHHYRNRRRARRSRAILYFDILAPAKSDNGKEGVKKPADILTRSPKKLSDRTSPGKEVSSIHN
jgi:hypothetical protein